MKPRSPRISSNDRATLDRFFSKLGIASRSEAERWIRAGRVRVNDRLIKNPNTWVSLSHDTVQLDHKTIQGVIKRFFLFHKPKGFVTTHNDEKNRRTVFELLPPEFGFIHAVGRLDQATTGLLLLTNEPRISSYFTDPSNGIDRIYLATVRGEFTEADTQKAIQGILDQDEILKCEGIKIQKASKRESHLELTLKQGKNREVRRLLKSLNHEVTRLRRIQFGPYQLRDLLPGQWLEIPIDDVIQEMGLK